FQGDLVDIVINNYESSHARRYWREERGRDTAIEKRTLVMPVDKLFLRGSSRKEMIQTVSINGKEYPTKFFIELCRVTDFTVHHVNRASLF
ncbi:unnamed protein product, partial [Cylicocyclus nassatus]